LLDLHHTLISQYRRRGVADGWLQPVGKAVWHISGEPGRAATFWVKLPPPVDILIRESTPFLTKTIPMGKDSESLPSSLSEIPANTENSFSPHIEKSAEPLSEKTATWLSEDKETTTDRKPHSEDSEVAWL
jgi:hypothetical protein